jgi:hypothetical protein
MSSHREIRIAESRLLIGLEMAKQAATELHEQFRNLPRQQRDRDLHFLRQEAEHMPFVVQMLQERIGLLVEADEDRCRVIAAELLQGIVIEDSTDQAQAAVSQPAQKPEKLVQGANPFYR